MELASLAQRRLLVVTGKGGSGKSVVSVALAHHFAQAGKKVWLVEFGRKRDQLFSRLPELVGRSKLTHERTQVKLPGTEVRIEASVLDPTRSLAEYVDLKLPTGGLAGVLLNNRVTASFLEVVPGLPDLVQMGKLWHSLNREEDGPDLVVLDAPSTGHAIALLKAPENFKRITRMGPIFKDASQMAEFILDPEKTALVLTALPEEMAVQETLELEKSLRKEFPRPFLFVNKCFPTLPAWRGAKKGPVAEAYAYASARAEREQEAAALLKGAQQIPFFFPEPEAPPLFLRISGALA